MQKFMFLICDLDNGIKFRLPTPCAPGRFLLGENCLLGPLNEKQSCPKNKPVCARFQWQPVM